MAWTPEDDKRIIEMFKNKASVIKNSDEFYKIKNDIASFFILKNKSAFEACVNSWYKMYFVDHSDGESKLYENLLTAIDQYNLDKAKGKFSSFFWLVNNRRIGCLLTKRNAQKRLPYIKINGKSHFLESVSLDRPIKSNDDELNTALGSKDTTEDQLHFKLLYDKLQKNLSNTQRHILARLLQGKSCKEIATILETHIPTIYKLKQKIKQENQEILNDL